MAESKADLILHPIRMRIIQSFIGGQHRTTLQLSERLPDIPQATMYRHLNKLLKAKLIEVVEERKIRGTVEKVFALAQNGADLTLEDVTEKAAEQHMEMFMKFAASLIGDFGSYLKQERFNMIEDGISYRQIQLYLTDEEYKQLLTEMRESMSRYIENGPGGGRRRRTLSTIVIPEAASAVQEKGDEPDA